MEVLELLLRELYFNYNGVVNKSNKIFGREVYRKIFYHN